MIHNMTITSEGTQKKIVVDGEDISRLVARAFINIDPVGLPEVHLVCTPMNLAIEADDVKIVEHVMTKPSEWIPVEERLPYDYEKVLIYDKKWGILSGWHERSGGWGTSEVKTTTEITHWMPNPEPPKEGEDG